ncbi:MAG: isoprenylcysteine carboxylmethyltransferase family protein [Tepidiformaceae bacterium]
MANLSLDVALVLTWAVFLYSHGHRVIADGVYTSLPFAIENAVLVGISLTRRSSRVTSKSWADWVVATAGAWLPLAFQTAAGANGLAGISGTLVQVVGLGVTVFSFLTLGRSFGIVAADRGLKVHGPYRIVRHPIYVGHSITMTGLVIANFSTFNALLLAVITTFQLLRILAEERVLTSSGDYAAYAARVRWRLLPGLY